MTPEQKDLVKSTWAKVVPISDTAATLFYARLFELDPATRALFKSTNMAGQRKTLMAAIGMVVGGLDRLETLMPAIEDLGRRHVDYGVTAAHYDVVGTALLDTLEKGLGDAWSPAARGAWAAAYCVLSDVMRNAAATSRAA
jgi:hemoglobin-like flavoprotein